MQKSLHSSSLLFLSFLLLYLTGGPSMAKEVIPIPIPIGVVLDLNSSLGTMAETCIRMGLMDFYNNNAFYGTRLALQIRDSENDVVAAASAAFDLIKNEKVHAIMGPQNSEEAKFVVRLGGKAQVPIISFSASGPSLSPTGTQFFIRDLSQIKAITAIVDVYGWHQIILIYEDTEYGKALIPFLTNALEEIDTQVLYKSVTDPRSEDVEIRKELNKLKGMETQVFLVHTTVDVGWKIFKLANKEGMMREGYAWIVTQGLSAMIDPMAPKVMGYMQGVLGVRPMVQKTKELVDFKRRWKVTSNKTNLTLFGLWAYDTIQALAIAVEKAGIVNSDITNKSKVETGPRLLNTILATKLKGLSGNFDLLEGWLEPLVLEVYNVIGQKERIIGYWTPQRGLVQDLDEVGKPNSQEKLKQPIWPGYTTKKPTKLTIGVPVKQGFSEFTNFAIDVFVEVVKVIPFPLSYEFNAVTAGTYDELLCQIKDKKLDVIVGDITILANRTKCVDFTLPYSESSVSMVVLMVPSSRMWILLKPFHWTLWLLLALVFSTLTLTIAKIESTEIKKHRGNVQQKYCDFLLFPFTVYTRAVYLNKWSPRMARISICLCVIIVQIYTANLTSILNGEKALQPSFKNIHEIKRHNHFVGYQRDSWVRGLLTQHLGFNESHLKAYDTPQEYHKALTLGSQKGGVAAIFDEDPYLKLFLSKYGSHYAITGATYKTYGFGFAFPRKSRLASDFSVAVLNVTQDIEIFEGILNKYSLSSSSIPWESQKASESPSLSAIDFGGLFLVIVGIIGLLCGFGVLALFVSEVVGRKHRSSSQPPETGLGAPLISNEEDDDEILCPDHNDTSTDSYCTDYY